MVQRSNGAPTLSSARTHAHAHTSTGFLDGVDRGPSATNLNSPDLPQWSSLDPSQSTSKANFERPRPIKIPPALSLGSPMHPISSSQRNHSSTSLILRNLHREIFKNASDVLPLLEPFGVIQRIRLISPNTALANAEAQNFSPTVFADKPQTLPSPITTPTEENPIPVDGQRSLHDRTNEHVEAVVEFATAFEVSAAVEALDGQLYGEIALQAERVVPSSLPTTRDDDSASLEAGFSSDDSIVGGKLPFRARCPTILRCIMKITLFIALPVINSTRSEAPLVLPPLTLLTLALSPLHISDHQLCSVSQAVSQ